MLGAGYGKTDWRELRKHVGLVSSSIRQMIGDEATALEVIVSGKEATLNFWGKISAADGVRGLQLLRQVEGMALAERRWAVLSQGERQRVLIGRALMSSPALLILDEPCAGPGPGCTRRVCAVFAAVGREAKRTCTGAGDAPCRGNRAGVHPCFIAARR